MHHLLDRPSRGDTASRAAVPDALARGAFAAEVRVSAVQLLPSDTNLRSNRRRPPGVGERFAGPGSSERASGRACALFFYWPEGRSPDALEARRPIGLPQKTKKVSHPAGSLLQRLATVHSSARGKRRMDARDRLFWDIQ